MEILTACGILVIVYVIYFLVCVYIESKQLPPGPFPLPILGNLHLLSSKPHLDFDRISKTYGPVFRLRMGCKRIIVINNYKYAKEAMLKRGTDFAGRPSQYVSNIFSRNGKGVGFQTYTDTLKIQRKIMIKILKEMERKSVLEDTVRLEVRELICRMQCSEKGQESEKLHFDLAMAISNTVASVIFGERFKEGDAEFVRLMDAVTVFQECLGAASFIDAFPFLKYLPFDIIDRVKKAIGVRDVILEKKYKEYKEKYENSSAASNANLTAALLEEAKAEKARGHEKLSDDHILMTMNDPLIAGSETPTTNLMWVIYYLIKYQDLQKRVQRELDEVIGRNGQAKWDERQNLPYLQAFLEEVLRLSGSMPFGLPHQTITDTCLGQYKIPKATMVVLNVWAIQRDPEMWENPLKFDPERFLDENGRYCANRAKGVLGFGLGHRSCPGETLAKMEAFLLTSRLLQNFDFKPLEGDVLPATSECNFGIVMRPPSFKLSISPRN